MTKRNPSVPGQSPGGNRGPFQKQDQPGGKGGGKRRPQKKKK